MTYEFLHYHPVAGLHWIWRFCMYQIPQSVFALGLITEANEVAHNTSMKTNSPIIDCELNACKVSYIVRSPHVSNLKGRISWGEHYVILVWHWTLLQVSVCQCKSVLSYSCLPCLWFVFHTLVSLLKENQHVVHSYALLEYMETKRSV